ncbi:MAG: Hsp70 family protein [Alkalispirochaeta sp.]
MIGIRLADHSVFPVFTSDAPGGKRVVLTTARDDQERVEIDLVQSDNYDMDRGRPLTIGRVILDDLQPGRGGEPEIDVMLRLTPDGRLDVSATNRTTGTEQSVSIDVDQATAEAEFSVPESLTDGFEPELAAEEEEGPRSRRSGWLLLIIMLLILAMLAAGTWWLLLRSPADEPSEPVPATQDTQSNEEESPPQETSNPPVAVADDQPLSSDHDSAEPAAESGTASNTPADSDSVEYRIRRGDTLWDISETFYGTPWLFPELAEANEISNPNLIFAESDLEIPEQLLRGED